VISTRWIEKRRPYWQQLEELLQRGGKLGLNSLNRAELQELSLLYRQTAADLAAIRQDPSSIHFARYLNQLMARAHNIIYAGHRASPLAMITFFYREYPRLFRRNVRYCLAALLLFAAGSVAGILLTLQDPDYPREVLGPRMMQTIEKKEMWTDSVLAIKPVASSGIMTNNITVGFMTYASGITAGLGTISLLFFNGLLMGVIGSACHIAGMSLKLWSFVAPHGALELPSIFIAGGAGFRIAHGLLFPGVLPRKESLALAGREATALVIGTVPMLVVAGVIEAFISPTALAAPLKFMLSGALLVLLLAYLFGVSREEEEAAVGRRESGARLDMGLAR
jgi:uncharacterized membrane protein SpoIIM required for sporulation